MEKLLPRAVTSFTGSTLMSGDGFVRRGYDKDGLRIDVTLAQRPMPAEQYEAWRRQTLDYPPITLEVPDGSASGFFSCAGTEPASSCDAHVQFRSGFHLELMGGGRATRSQLADLLRELPVREIAMTRQP
jgi:hypothetical protein